MFDVHIQGHICDLVDAGLEESLDDIQSTGATGVTAIVTSGPQYRLRCQAMSCSRLLRSRGGFYFQPDEAVYRALQSKPITSRWLAGRNPLDDLVEQCNSRDLHLRLRISAFEVGRMAATYPQLAACSILGMPSALTLCPAHSEVGLLLRATISDLVNRYGDCLIEVSDIEYHSGIVTDGELEAGFAVDDVVAWMLAICFSESSRKAAAEVGVDVEKLVSELKGHFEKTLLGSSNGTDALRTVMEDSEELAAYTDSQLALLEGVIREMVAGMADRVVLNVPWQSVADGDFYPFGSCGVAECLVKGDVDDLLGAGVVESYHKVCGTESRLGVELDVVEDLANDPQHLVSRLKQLVDQGYSHATLRPFGLIPPASWDAVKQAIRFARRSAGQ